MARNIAAATSLPHAMGGCWGRSIGLWIVKPVFLHEGTNSAIAGSVCFQQLAIALARDRASLADAGQITVDLTPDKRT